MAMKIAILEDNDDRQAVMRARLTDRFYQYDTCLFASAGEMIHFLDEHLADTLVISLDHDLELRSGPDGRCADPGTGRDVADYLAGRDPVCPVIIHTTNVPAAAGMKRVLHDAHWKTCRVVPFDDLQWIDTEWFLAVRRAIVGPVKTTKTERAKTGS
jgi:hypothetical protein